VVVVELSMITHANLKKKRRGKKEKDKEIEEIKNKIKQTPSNKPKMKLKPQTISSTRKLLVLSSKHGWPTAGASIVRTVPF
jgi:glucosamine 6-phosphate synthetase-like amidotransferase/phosphosugar isomerase protein